MCDVVGVARHLVLDRPRWPGELTDLAPGSAREEAGDPVGERLPSPGERKLSGLVDGRAGVALPPPDGSHSSCGGPEVPVSGTPRRPAENLSKKNSAKDVLRVVGVRGQQEVAIRGFEADAVTDVVATAVEGEVEVPDVVVPYCP